MTLLSNDGFAINLHRRKVRHRYRLGLVWSVVRRSARSTGGAKPPRCFAALRTITPPSLQQGFGCRAFFATAEGVDPWGALDGPRDLAKLAQRVLVRGMDLTWLANLCIPLTRYYTATALGCNCLYASQLYIPSYRQLYTTPAASALSSRRPRGAGQTCADGVSPRNGRERVPLRNKLG
eukprot:scaffold1168_cov87-Phaeocystis_antarctica.AAC.2